MQYEWIKSGDIPLTRGVSDLTCTNDTYVLVSDIPSGDLGTIALSPIATSENLTEWTVRKRINPSIKYIRLFTVDTVTYYVGTEQNSATIYSTENNVDFTRVIKFFNFTTNTSRSRIRKIDTTYIITLLGGFITYNSGEWNLVQLSTEYKDYYVLDTALSGTTTFLLYNDNQYALASYANNNLTYVPFSTDGHGTYYGLVSNQEQLLILGSYKIKPSILIKETDSNWIVRQIEISDNIYENYEYSLRDGLYINGAWVFVGVVGKYNGPSRIFITENSLIYTNIGNVTKESDIEKNSSPSVFGLDRIYNYNNKLIALGTGYPNNDRCLIIASLP